MIESVFWPNKTPMSSSSVGCTVAVTVDLITARAVAIFSRLVCMKWVFMSTSSAKDSRPSLICNSPRCCRTAMDLKLVRNRGRLRCLECLPLQAFDDFLLVQLVFAEIFNVAVHG